MKTLRQEFEAAMETDGRFDIGEHNVIDVDGLRPVDGHYDIYRDDHTGYYYQFSFNQIRFVAGNDESFADWLKCAF